MNLRPATNNTCESKRGSRKRNHDEFSLSLKENSNSLEYKAKPRVKRIKNCQDCERTPLKEINNFKSEVCQKTERKIKHFPEKTEVCNFDIDMSDSNDSLNDESTSTIGESESERKCQQRLFLGEADLSYTKALIKKHSQRYPTLKNSITATSYESQEQLELLYPHTFLTNKSYLEDQKVALMDQVNATLLHKDIRLKDRNIQRIHFNFPHDGSRLSDRTLPEMIKSFFKSARSIQENKGRIYMALPKPYDAKTRQFREAYIYGIYDAARQAGYNYICKRKFGPERYPGYVHKMTTSNTSAPIAEQSREFIFEKLPYNSSPNLFKQPIPYYAYDEFHNALPEIATDSESSEYMEE